LGAGSATYSAEVAVRKRTSPICLPWLPGCLLTGKIMKRIAKILGIVLVVLVILIGAALAVIYEKSSKRFAERFDVPAPPIAVPSGTAALAEGKRLFITRGCGDCHGADLAGQEFVNDPMAGHFAGANLTGSKGGAGNELSDAEFARAIRHGVGKDGRALIFMPSTDFAGFSDSDVGLLIAYIRSVPPVDKPSADQKPGPITRLLMLTGKMPILVSAASIDHKAAPQPAVKADVSMAFGRYLAASCTGCHGAGFSGGAIAGGPPDWPPAKNLTPDATGLKAWSETDFIKAMRTGVDPKGGQIRFPMPWRNFSLMTDTELKALWLYLQSVPSKALGNH
jgi:mono/diheme cytochrome c family protein